MPDGFVPLHVLLAAVRAPASDDRTDGSAPTVTALTVTAPTVCDPPVAVDRSDEIAAAREVRLFRARLAEALADAQATLVRELAYAVLGRELHLAPADVGVIAARILAEHAAAEPIVVRAAPGEAGTILGPVPVEVDPALAPGDVMLDFRCGFVDARLGVRLASVLEAWS